MKSLTGEVILKIGPLVLDVIVKHWFDRFKKKDLGGEDDGEDLGARLKGEDLLYHGVFVVAKEVLNAATFHTVEEMQSFANKRTPSPPSVSVVRTQVPLSQCDEAASYIIQALGGEDGARQTIGGVKWWQVRAVKGVDAEWISMKKDWPKAKEMQQGQARMGVDSPSSSPLEGRGSGTNSGIYVNDNNMDGMRCILYLHGGGYYFGSVDQTRYSIQRFARKINGRVFAINYRLAPQYPFPCALHDALAAYLFLIRPPPESDHLAINPANIIISGDSAGGGLSLALLQVIRDTGLPLPAGGVLISPWCDLTHSFPSIYQNIERDFLPESGISFHKLSDLWPPPSQDISKQLHASIRTRIKQDVRFDESSPIEQMSTISEEDMSPFDWPSNSGLQTSRNREKIDIKVSTGDVEEISGQLHFYTTNKLLNHPLVSPITGYLGGLPPLLFIAGDDEVLRDEIIYTAHKAAYPEKYPVHSSCRLLCPHMQDMKKGRKGPTSVHLQVYDGTHHILPVLFTFTTPAKFCFRAIANFDRFVTNAKVSMPMTTTGRSSSSSGGPQMVQKRNAGDPQVYEDIKDRFNWESRMIRERVSTSGIIRDLEPEDELAACKMPHGRIGQISEVTVRRYLETTQRFNQRFGHTTEAIQKKRENNLAKSETELTRQIALLQQSDSQMHNGADQNPRPKSRLKFDRRVLSSPASCAWSWVLDDREEPPPSSIAGRRDTKEARKLAAVGGWATQDEDL